MALIGLRIAGETARNRPDRAGIERLQQRRMGNQPRHPAIAVGKWVNPYQTMMRRGRREDRFGFADANVPVNPLLEAIFAALAQSPQPLDETPPRRKLLFRRRVRSEARPHGGRVLLEEQLLSEFAARIHAEVKDALAELEPGTSLTEDAALAETVLGYLEEAGLVAEHDLCPHEDTGQRRSRVLAYSLPDDSSRLELFTGIYLPPNGSETLPPAEVRRLTGWAARFFEYAVKGDHARFGGNDRARQAAQRIRAEAARIEDVRVHVLTNAIVRDRAVASIPVEGREVEFSVWDIERLHRATGEEIARERIEIDFRKLLGRPIPCLEMKPPSAEYQTFLLVMPGELIYRLYEEYGARLFEFNVRSFLQARSNVNKGIRDTIRNQPERFLAYNNGLTATADEIEAGQWNGETVIHRLRGLQIVNGAQTTASIHRAVKEKFPIDRLAVAMKLTRVEPAKLDEFVPLIARFANTQNPVQVADLSANNAFHIRLEQLAGDVWCPGEESRWFYERARGAYEVARARFGSTPAKRRDFDEEIPKRQVFGKTDLAKYLMSWWQHPDVVSRGAQKNFGSFMSELRDRHGPDWLPDAAFFRSVVAISLVFKAAQVSVRRGKVQSYGANVATYMVAKLSLDHGETFDPDAVWEAQEVSPELVATLESWVTPIHSQLVTSAGQRNVTEWCKKEACWEHMRAQALPLILPAPPEFVPRDERERGEAPPTVAILGGGGGDNALVDACCLLDGASWAKVIAWAATSSGVTDFDRRVARTVMGYALQAWRRRPSEKQAACAVRVIAAARHAGVIPPP
jgi:hypothetical protein